MLRIYPNSTGSMIGSDSVSLMSGASRFRTRLADDISQMKIWADRRRARQSLAELDDHLLADIGLSREAVRREASQPFWRPWL